MKYMLLAYSPENSWTESEWKGCLLESMDLCRELMAKGQFIAASPLHPVATALSVRVRGGKTLVTTGPFAETAEQLGGFFLIDVPNLDEAISIAARLPSARKGTMEVRPLAALDNTPLDRYDAEDPERKKYMLLSYDDEKHWDAVGPDAMEKAINEAVELTHELNKKGQYISAAPLHRGSTATSVRIRHGKRMITDGPFAETNEVLGGFYMVFAKDINEAASMGAKHSGAPHGTVEVREVYALQW
jgi:hypothetical protein